MSNRRKKKREWITIQFKFVSQTFQFPPTPIMFIKKERKKKKELQSIRIIQGFVRTSSAKLEPAYIFIFPPQQNMQNRPTGYILNGFAWLPFFFDRILESLICATISRKVWIFETSLVSFWSMKFSETNSVAKGSEG